MHYLRSIPLLLVLAAIPALPAVDPGLLGLVMPEARVLSGIQVAQGEASPFGQYVISQIQTAPGIDRLAFATGFDPRRDLQEILAAGVGGRRTLVLARGSFQPDTIMRAATAAGGTPADYRGIGIVRSS